MSKPCVLSRLLASWTCRAIVPSPFSENSFSVWTGGVKGEVAAETWARGYHHTILLYKQAQVEQPVEDSQPNSLFISVPAPPSIAIASLHSGTLLSA